MTDEKWKSPTGHPISSSETDNVELKPCPFCGNEAYLETIEAQHTALGHTDLYQANCSNENCLAYMCFNKYDRKTEAIKAWNTRANEPDTVSVAVPKEGE